MFSNPRSVFKIALAVLLAATVGTVATIVYWFKLPFVLIGGELEQQPPPAVLWLFLPVLAIAFWNAILFGIYSRRMVEIDYRKTAIAEACIVIPIVIAIVLALALWEPFGIIFYAWVGVPTSIVGIVYAVSGLARNLDKERKFPIKVNGRITAVLLIAGAAWLVFIGISPTGILASRPQGISVTKVSNNFDSIPGQFIASDMRTPYGGVGDCVALSGTKKNQSIATKVDCTSPNASYKIFQVAEAKAQCSADADQRFGAKEFALCLDYNWSSTACMRIGGTDTWYSSRAECSRGMEKPKAVLVGTDLTRGCPSGGFAHAERRFTICTETLK